MVNLLVSKIDNIQVIQVDESRLSVAHKEAKSNKPSPFDKVGGENYSVDLGAGEKVHSIKIHTLDKNETDALFDLLYNKRNCTITDKFVGKIKVKIDKVEIVNSDKHIGKTIFNITATVQDIKKVPTVNATAQLKQTIATMEEEVAIECEKFANTIKEVGTTDTIVDELTNEENYLDLMLDAMEQSLQDIVDLAFIAFDFYNGIQSRVNRIKRIGETLSMITTLPNAFIDLMLGITDIFTSKNVGLFETSASNGRVIKSSNEDLSEFSQIEITAIKKSLQTNQLLNLVTATGEMKQALTKQYKSQQEFDAQVSLCITRLESTNLSYENIVIAQQVLKAYSNTKHINSIVDYEVTKETPLIAIVYELYGSTENYDVIKTINNFADNDAIIGTIKVYEYASIS
jgi:hypothetical protein